MTSPDLPPPEQPRSVFERSEEPLRPGSPRVRRDLLRLQRNIDATVPENVQTSLNDLRSLASSVNEIPANEFNVSFIRLSLQLTDAGAQALVPVMREWERAEEVHRELLRAPLATLFQDNHPILQAMLRDPVQGPQTASAAFNALSRTRAGLATLGEMLLLEDLSPDTLRAAIDALHERRQAGTSTAPSVLESLIREAEGRVGPR